jgi:ADP-ribosyl-[dinitrogen reductase] hydrolase
MANFERSAILGLVVGDALGVPVEFKSRKDIAKRPVVDMIGFGTYNLPEGTWSDDSSLALCLADVLGDDYNLEKIGESFVEWLFENRWTPRGRVFDVGNATRQAIYMIKRGMRAEVAGGLDDLSNGNGSLMRIMPLLFFIKNKSEKERFDITSKVSSITHGHIRSVLACFYYLEFARLICEGQNKLNAYSNANLILKNKFDELQLIERERKEFNRILSGELQLIKRQDIRSSGYVMHALEASIWCILTSKTYKEAVLKAVNLGDDTDTTAAITGGLAGLVFGENDIPKAWIGKIARINDIENVIQKLKMKYSTPSV